MFRHPSYYKKLRERNKSGQVISTDRSRDKSSVAPIERSPGLGQKRQASSSKLRYTPTGILLGVDLGPRPKPRASSTKRLEPQAASVKPRG